MSHSRALDANIGACLNSIEVIIGHGLRNARLLISREEQLGVPDWGRRWLTMHVQMSVTLGTNVCCKYRWKWLRLQWAMWLSRAAGSQALFGVWCHEW